MLLKSINIRRDNGKLYLSGYPLFAVDLFDLLTVGLSYEMPFFQNSFFTDSVCKASGKTCCREPTLVFHWC